MYKKVLYYYCELKQIKGSSNMNQKKQVKINMNEDCKFLADLNNNNQIGIYNLITSIGGVKLFTKGIKPNRNWTLKSVKNYFGLSGNTQSILKQLETLHAIILGRK